MYAAAAAAAADVVRRHIIANLLQRFASDSRCINLDSCSITSESAAAHAPQHEHSTLSIQREQQHQVLIALSEDGCSFSCTSPAVAAALTTSCNQGEHAADAGAAALMRRLIHSLRL